MESSLTVTVSLLFGVPYFVAYISAWNLVGVGLVKRIRGHDGALALVAEGYAYTWICKLLALWAGGAL